MSKIAFLGLGVMGYPMAGHIAAAGHDVTVYNRTTARAEAWVAEHGGSHAPTPAAAAAGADIVLSCVGDDPDVLQVALGPDGAIPAMREGAIYIDNSTVSADVARKLAVAGSERGISAQKKTPYPLTPCFARPSLRRSSPSPTGVEGQKRQAFLCQMF